MMFIDTNVFLDVLDNRKPWLETSTEVIDYIRTGKDKGCISALTIPVLWYLMGEKSESVGEIQAITKHFKVISLNSYILNLSFKTDMYDFEDAIQLNSALQAEVKYLITRNKKDFKTNAKVDILTPEEFLEKQGKS